MQAVILLGIIMIICIGAIVFFWKKTHHGKKKPAECKPKRHVRKEYDDPVVEPVEDEPEIDSLIGEIESI